MTSKMSKHNFYSKYLTRIRSMKHDAWHNGVWCHVIRLTDQLIVINRYCACFFIYNNSSWCYTILNFSRRWSKTCVCRFRSRWRLAPIKKCAADYLGPPEPHILFSYPRHRRLLAIYLSSWVFNMARKKYMLCKIRDDRTTSWEN